MLEIGTRLAIKGTWDTTRVPRGRETVLLEPSHHDISGNPYMPYTRSMLERMEILIPPAAVVIDLGAGNGSLLLAALKLGARAAWAYEIADGVPDIIRGNARANSVNINVVAADFRGHVLAASDLVLCNIDILETLQTAILQAEASLSAGGHFLCMVVDIDLLALDATSPASMTLTQQEPVLGGWVRADFVKG